MPKIIMRNNPRKITGFLRIYYSKTYFSTITYFIHLKTINYVRSIYAS